MSNINDTGFNIFVRVLADQATSVIDSLKTAFVGLLDKITNVSLSFEQEMRNVNSIAKETEASFKLLGIEIRKLSENKYIKDSPVELAKSMYTLVSSGFKAKEALEMAGIASIAASAGMTQASVSVMALSAMMNAYSQKTIKDATMYSDLLFKVVDKGVITFEQLASSLGSVLPVAAATKVAFTEVGALYIEMTKAGVSAGMSQVAATSILREFIKPHAAAAKVLKEYGIEMNLSTIQSKGLTRSIREMYDAVGQNKETMARIFGLKEQQRAIFAMLKNDMKDYTQSVNDMRNANGATLVTAEEQLKASQAQMDKLKASIDNLFIGFGEKLLVGFVPLIKIAQDVVGLLNSMDSSTKANIISFVKWLTIIGTIIGGLGTLLLAVHGVSIGLTSLWTVITAVGAAWTTSFLLLTPGGWLIIGITSLIAILAVLGAGFTALHIEIGNLKELGDPFSTKIAGALEYFDVIEKITNRFKMLQQFIKDIPVFAQAKNEIEAQEKEKRDADEAIKNISSRASKLVELKEKYGDLAQAQKVISDLDKKKDQYYLTEMRNQQQLNGGLIVTNEQKRLINEKLNKRVGYTEKLLQQQKDLDGFTKPSSDEFTKLSNSYITKSTDSQYSAALKKSFQEKAIIYKEEARLASIEEQKIKFDEDERARIAEQEKRLKEGSKVLKDSKEALALERAKGLKKELLQLEIAQRKELDGLKDKFNDNDEKSFAQHKEAINLVNLKYLNKRKDAEENFNKEQHKKMAEKEIRTEEKRLNELHKQINRNDSNYSDGYINKETYDSKNNELFSKKRKILSGLANSTALTKEERDKYFNEYADFLDEIQKRKTQSIKKIQKDKLDDVMETISIDRKYFEMEQNNIQESYDFNVASLEKEKKARQEYLKTLPEFAVRAKKNESDRIKEIDNDLHIMKINLLFDTEAEEKAGLQRTIDRENKIRDMERQTLDYEQSILNERAKNGEISENQVYEQSRKIILNKIANLNKEKDAEELLGNDILALKIRISSEQSRLNNLDSQNYNNLIRQKQELLNSERTKADDNLKYHRIQSDEYFSIIQNIRLKEVELLKQKQVSTDQMFEHMKEIDSKLKEIETARLDHEKETIDNTISNFNSLGDVIGVFDQKSASMFKDLLGAGESIGKAFASGGADIGADIQAIAKTLDFVKKLVDFQNDMLKKSIEETKQMKTEIDSVTASYDALQAKLSGKLEDKIKASNSKFTSELRAQINSNSERIQKLLDEIHSMQGFSFESFMNNAFGNPQQRKAYEKLIQDKYKQISDLEEINNQHYINMKDEHNIEIIKMEQATQDKLSKLDIDNIRDEEERRKQQYDLDKKMLLDSLNNKDITISEYESRSKKLDTDYFDYKITKENAFVKLKLELLQDGIVKIKETYIQDLKLLEQQLSNKLIKEERYLVEKAILTKKYQNDLLSSLNAMTNEKEQLAQKLLDLALNPKKKQAEIDIENIRIKMRPIQSELDKLNRTLDDIDRRYQKLNETANKDSSTAFKSSRSARLGDINKNDPGFYGVSQEGFQINQDAAKEDISSMFLNGEITDAQRIDRLKKLSVDANIFYAKIAEDVKKSQGTTKLYYEYVKMGNDAYAEFNSLFKDDISVRQEAEEKIIETQKQGLEDQLQDFEDNISDMELTMTTFIESITSMFKDSAGNFSDTLIEKVTGEGGAFAIIKSQWQTLSSEINTQLETVKSALASSSRSLAYSQETGYVASAGNTSPVSSSKALATASDAKSGETMDEYIVRITKEDAMAQNKSSSVASPSATYTKPTTTSNQGYDQNTGIDLGAGLTPYNSKTQSSDEWSLLREQEARGIYTAPSIQVKEDKPWWQFWDTGGVSDPKRFNILGEKRQEAAVTYPDFQNIYDYVLKTTSGGSGGSPTLYVNVSGNYINSDLDIENLSNTISKNVMSELKAGYSGK